MVSGLSRALRAPVRALLEAASEIAVLSPSRARARVKAILREHSIAAETIAAAGTRLERSTRARWEAGISGLVEAKLAKTRGDRKGRSTTISLSVPRTGAVKITAPDVGDNVDAWAKRAAKMVRTVEEDAIEGMARDVAAALEAGETPAELAARWRSEGLPLKGGGRLESTLDLIAENQLGRLNSDLARTRSKAAGLSEYRWVTMGDARVRELHRQLERGGPRSWDDPHPTEGHPGHAPRCRCHAESVVTDDDLDRLLGLA